MRIRAIMCYGRLGFAKDHSYICDVDIIREGVLCKNGYYGEEFEFDLVNDVDSRKWYRRTSLDFDDVTIISVRERLETEKILWRRLKLING